MTMESDMIKGVCSGMMDVFSYTNLNDCWLRRAIRIFDLIVLAFVMF
jgi:hypothetical protein